MDQAENRISKQIAAKKGKKLSKTSGSTLMRRELSMVLTAGPFPSLPPSLPRFVTVLRFAKGWPTHDNGRRTSLGG